MRRKVHIAVVALFLAVLAFAVHEVRGDATTAYHQLVDGRAWIFTGGIGAAPGGVNGVRGSSRESTTTINFLKDAYDCASDGCGPWASRASATSTSESITVTGAVIGDACTPLFGTLASGTNQALDYTCKVSAADTAILRVTNASGTTITPKTGKRGVHVEGP